MDGPLKLISLIPAVLLAAILSSLGQDTIINLTEDTIDGVPVSDSGFDTPLGEDVIGGYIDGAFFRRTLDSDDFGSGSGGFRDLYRVQDRSTATDPQDGYNRTVFDDVSIPGGFFPLLTVGDLTASAESDSYVFAFDTHESTGGTEEYISLDSFQIYIGSNTDPSPLPDSVANLGDLGTLIYDMDSTGDNYILGDSSIFAGSGQMDIFAFVPTTLFSGFAADSYVYVFTSWGSYSFDDPTRTAGFGTTATPEQISSASQVYDSYATVPEPSSTLLLCVAGLFWLLRRPVRRAAA